MNRHLFTALIVAFGFNLALSFTAGAQTSPAESVRIAILNASSSDELEPLLVATLSKTEGIELVERTEVERILKEHALSKAGNLEEQLSIASLLHADGLLILDKGTVDKSEIVTVHFGVAVELSRR